MKFSEMQRAHLKNDTMNERMNYKRKKVGGANNLAFLDELDIDIVEVAGSLEWPLTGT